MSELIAKVRELEASRAVGEITAGQCREAVMDAVSAHWNDPMSVEDAKAVLTVLASLRDEGVLETTVYEEVFRHFQGRSQGAPPPEGMQPAGTVPVHGAPPPQGMRMKPAKAPKKGLGRLVLSPAAIILIVLALAAVGYVYGPAWKFKHDFIRDLKSHPEMHLESMGDVDYDYAHKTAAISDLEVSITESEDVTIALHFGRIETTNPNATRWVFMTEDDFPSRIVLTDFTVKVKAGAIGITGGGMALKSLAVDGMAKEGSIKELALSELTMGVMGMMNFGIESLDVSNLDFSEIIKQMETSGKSFEDMDFTRFVTYDSWEMRNLTLGSMFLGGGMSMEAASASNPKQPSGNRVASESTVTAWAFDAAMIRELIPDEDMKDFLDGLGYRKLIFDLAGKYTWDGGTGSYVIKDFHLGLREGADLFVDMALTGVSSSLLDSFSSQLEILDSLDSVGLERLELRLEDNSLAKRLITATAKMAGKTEQEALAALEQELLESLGETAPDAVQFMLSDAVLTFLNNPESFFLTLEPAAPTPITELMAKDKNFLNLRLRVNGL